MKKLIRDLIKILCTTCGSSYEVFYDKKNDEHICKECLDHEEENESSDDEEE